MKLGLKLAFCHFPTRVIITITITIAIPISLPGLPLQKLVGSFHGLGCMGDPPPNCPHP